MEPTYVSPAQKIMPWVSQQQEGKQGKEFSTMLEKLMAMFSWRKVVDFGTVVYFVIIWQIIPNYELIKFKRFISC